MAKDIRPGEHLLRAHSAEVRRTLEGDLMAVVMAPKPDGDWFHRKDLARFVRRWLADHSKHIPRSQVTRLLDTLEK